jgi:lysyl-tRNA synthetase class 2
MLSEQELRRREEREELIKMGIDPYPADLFEVNATSDDILKNYTDNTDAYQKVSIAGRLMSNRDMGNACFVSLKDDNGRIKV